MCYHGRTLCCLPLKKKKDYWYLNCIKILPIHTHTHTQIRQCMEHIFNVFLWVSKHNSPIVFFSRKPNKYYYLQSKANNIKKGNIFLFIFSAIEVLLTLAGKNPLIHIKSQCPVSFTILHHPKQGNYHSFDYPPLLFPLLKNTSVKIYISHKAFRVTILQSILSESKALFAYEKKFHKVRDIILKIQQNTLSTR